MTLPKWLHYSKFFSISWLFLFIPCNFGGCGLYLTNFQYFDQVSPNNIFAFSWGENPAGCIMTKKESDGTQLLAALEASELAGAVSMSYSLLLHQGAPSRPRAVDGINSKINTDDLPPPPGEKTAEIVKSTLCLINAMARLDLVALQVGTTDYYNGLNKYLL